MEFNVKLDGRPLGGECINKCHTLIGILCAWQNLQHHFVHDLVVYCKKNPKIVLNSIKK